MFIIYIYRCILTSFVQGILFIFTHPPYPHPSLLTQLYILSIFNPITSNLCCPYIFGCAAFHCSMVSLSGVILLEKMVPPVSSNNQLPIAYRPGLGLHAHLASTPTFGLDWTCTGYMHGIPGTSMCPEDTVSLQPPTISGTYTFPSFSSTTVPCNLAGRLCDIYGKGAPLMVEYSSVSFSASLSDCGSSVLITIFGYWRLLR